jgi:alkanesulfonate monooxygenase SsuD/methylene tetrahydromethanopterin reductase-like flavin-dependent oxidoreductase (luciferase family)
VAPLHLGVILPNYGAGLDPEALAGAAVAAEQEGFDSGWVTDHLIVPVEHAGTYGTIAEALVLLGFLAGRTRRLQLGVSALVVPQRQPFVAPLRSIPIAAGWMEGEFASLGARYEGRGRLLNEWLSAAASLFEQMPGRVGYEGRLLSVDGWMAPPLVRPGGLELWVAGVSRATLRRAEMTSVWHPVALPPDELRTMAAEFRARRPDGRVILRIGVYPRPEPQAGKDERGRHALAGPPEWIAERLSEYVAGGCNGFVLNLDHDSPGLEERVREFAAEIAPLLRAA